MQKHCQGVNVLMKREEKLVFFSGLGQGHWAPGSSKPPNVFGCSDSILLFVQEEEWWSSPPPPYAPQNLPKFRMTLQLAGGKVAPLGPWVE